MALDWLEPTDIPLGGFNASLDVADHFVVGAPLDETASFRSGCGDAPLEIRKMASNLEPVDIYTWSDIADVFVHDFGDIIFENREDLFRKIETLMNTYTSKTPLMLGGEHTVTAAVANRFKNHLFIMLDAHADLRDSYNGNHWSHACVARRLVEKVGGEHLFQIGLRGITKEEKQFATENGIRQYFSFIWRKHIIEYAVNEIKDLLPSFEGLYLTVDMDVFDPAFVPGVGNPEPLGLTPREIFQILDLLPRYDGMDIVELNPQFDPTGASQSVAARLAMFLLCHNDFNQR